MEKAHRAEIADLKSKHDDMDRRFKEMKGLYEIESKAHAEIESRLFKERAFNMQKIREMATLLKIPRLHFNYIKENGVDDFVTRCKEYVDYHDMLYEEQERSRDRLKAREGEAVEKFDNSSLTNTFKKANKDYNTDLKRPPFIQVFPERSKKTPSPPLRRPQSDMMDTNHKNISANPKISEENFTLAIASTLSSQVMI